MLLYSVLQQRSGETSQDLKGNMRDHANVQQLVCLANLESMNAHFIEQGLSPSERLIRLNSLAIKQMNILLRNRSINRLE